MGRGTYKVENHCDKESCSNGFISAVTSTRRLLLETF